MTSLLALRCARPFSAKPKRPLSGYLRWSAGKYAEYPPKERFQKIAHEWALLDETEKQRLSAMTREDMDQYRAQLQAWKAEQPAPVDVLKFMPGIKLLVCDVVGTSVLEDALVDGVLKGALTSYGLTVLEEDIKAWKRATKREIVTSIVKSQRKETLSRSDVSRLIEQVLDQFDKSLDEAYFAGRLGLSVVDGLPALFDSLRQRKVKVALTSSYSPKMQEQVLKQFGLAPLVNACVISQTFRRVAPYPFLIQEAMRQCDVMDVRTVANAGDTVNDILSGINAGCGQTVGVLSGAHDRDALIDAGAHTIATKLTDVSL